ncbi:MAG TPA: hypothetical protein VE268_07670 [Herpetosiphonaceae bacterium]|jgi:hypothetical protein|nr:hypothetical protein [Herpetosiphonaceae bacterium]
MDDQGRPIIVGHLYPDLDCLAAIWLLQRWGGMQHAELTFVPAGKTLDDQPVDSNPHIIHVDTGGGRFDHHRTNDFQLSAAELVRRSVAPEDEVLTRLIHRVTQIDHAQVDVSPIFNVNDLIGGYHELYPESPATVVTAMLPNFDAWYAWEARQLRLEAAFARRIEFDTPWGLGIAMESDDGGSARLAFGHRAILYVYRDAQGRMGIAARSRSNVDLTPVYRDLRRIEPDADWYLHPSKRLLLCGTAKAPPRVPSKLSLEELVGVLRGDFLF